MRTKLGKNCTENKWQHVLRSDKFKFEIFGSNSDQYVLNLNILQ